MYDLNILLWYDSFEKCPLLKLFEHQRLRFRMTALFPMNYLQKIVWLNTICKILMNIRICWVLAKPASPAADHQEWAGWWSRNPGNHWFGQREIGREFKRALTSFKTLHSSKWKSKSSRLVSWISTRKSSFSLKVGRLKFPIQQFSSWR